MGEFPLFSLNRQVGDIGDQVHPTGCVELPSKVNCGVEHLERECANHAVVCGVHNGKQHTGRCVCCSRMHIGARNRRYECAVAVAGQVLLDFTGGSLSLAQLFMDASHNNDWSAVIGDPVKFGSFVRWLRCLFGFGAMARALNHREVCSTSWCGVRNAPHLGAPCVWTLL